VELAYIDRGIRKALEHAQFLAVGPEDLREIYRNKIHARTAGKKIREEGIDDILKQIEQVEISQGEKFRNVGDAVGYFIGMQAAINGKQGVKNAIGTIKSIKHLPPNVAADVLVRYILPHATPPLYVIKNPDKTSPQRKILTRIVLRAVGNSLPEITEKMLDEAKMARKDLDEDEIRKRLRIIRAGRETVHRALEIIQEEPEKAKAHIESHVKRLNAENVNVHGHYEKVFEALEQGRISEAKAYLQMIEYGQENHEKALQRKLDRIVHGKLERADAHSALSITAGREKLLGFAHEMDLGNTESTRHWEEFSEREMRRIERVLAENNAKIEHVENLQRLFRQNSIRRIVRKAIVWSERMGQEQKSVDKLIWGIASRDPRVMQLIENYHFKNNGIGDLLRKISKLDTKE